MHCQLDDPLGEQPACPDPRATDALPSQVTTLKNGLKVASADMTVPSTSVGLYIDTGSRYDVVSGTAHMLQHMAFKVCALQARMASS
jgi:predicted Zn-dependent peptidase